MTHHTRRMRVSQTMPGRDWRLPVGLIATGWIPPENTQDAYQLCFSAGCLVDPSNSRAKGEPNSTSSFHN